MPVFRISHAAALSLFVMTGAAQAHEGPHLHPHLLAESSAQPLHPAVVLALLLAGWAACLFCADALGGARRRRRG
jgi:hypothetical protein